MYKLGLAFALGTFTVMACSGEAGNNDAAGGASLPRGGSAGSNASGGRSATGGTVNGGSPASGGAVGGGGTLGAGGSKGGAPGHGGVGAGGVDGGGVGGAGGGDLSAGGDYGSHGSAGSAGDNSSSGAGGAGGHEGRGECAAALPLKCGDSLNHSTLVEGRPNKWSGYSATQRGESGRETVYVFETSNECTVVATLKNLTTDLDLLLLQECNPIANPKASSTPIDLQTVETINWTNGAGKSVYVVVDGYAGAEGTYTLQVDCSCN